MEYPSLSPLATASRDLVVQLSEGADPDVVEAGCRELLTNNTNGMGSSDTKVVEVASEIVRGVLHGALLLRSPAIEAAARGLSTGGNPGAAGDAERLSISERACRDVRDSDDASRSDFNSALRGAAKGSLMSVDQLRLHLDTNPTDEDTNPTKQPVP